MPAPILPRWKTARKHCLVCGALLTLRSARDLKRKKFCSHRCQGFAMPNPMAGRRHSAETKAFQSFIAREQGRLRGAKNPNHGGKVQRGRPMPDHVKDLHRQRMRAGGAAWARKHAGGKKSSIQRAVEKYLAGHGVPFEPEKIINGHAVDIFVAPNVCIECDGSYWHSLPEQQGRDRRFAEFCEREGFRLIRLPEADIRSGRFKQSLTPWIPVSPP
jgi:very-short-patch-repair endonuclease/predicted nucleic acid-binding Zn ribbon protein